MFSQGRRQPNHVEAYDCQWDSCAASLDCSYKPWPLHPRTFNQDHCVQPFMALHNAHILAMQCGTFAQKSREDLDDLSLISCFGPLPTWTPFSKQLKATKTVTFSSLVEVYKVSEDEIGCDLKYTLSDQLKANPHMHHFTDDHTRPTHERFRDEFQQQPQIDAHAHVLAQQPVHIQDLAITFHRFGVFDPRMQERYIKVLTWFIHGQDTRECRMPRIVRLPEDFTRWNQLMTSAWHGLLHPHEAIWFFFVEPEPPTAEWEEHDAQIILVQNPRHFERATLYTMIFHARAQVAIQRIARFSRSPVHLSDCVDYAEVPHQVRHRLIHGYYGWRSIHDHPQPATQLVDGAAIVIHIRPEPDSPSQHEQYPFDFLWENDDYVP